MADPPAEFGDRIARVAADRESGASEILDEVIAVLRDALRTGAPITLVARDLCRAQPSMAPVWNAAVAALASPARFERFAQRVAHAPAALARFGVECFSADAPHMPLRIVTLSFSRSVLVVLDALARTRTITIACSEGRPALEGRRLASRLAESGIAVSFFSDAAIGHALASADAVLVGADAVGPEWVLNKSGTRLLAAAAMQRGLPVHVVASRDKFVSRAIAARLVAKEGSPADIWEAPPARVTVRNPYFEFTPLDLVTSLITDMGVLGAGMVPDVCKASDDGPTLQALDDVAP